jgi:hypothetical protein
MADSRGANELKTRIKFDVRRIVSSCLSNYNPVQRAYLIGLVVFCATTALFLYHCVFRALDAEETYGDIPDVVTIVTTYLENNPEWPNSWDDLERTSVPLHSHKYELPASPIEFEEWKKRVCIDFTLTRSEVAAMTPENFSAIRPIGPCWPPDVRNLLKVAGQDDGCEVLQVLTTYLKNHTEWPKDWNDLQQIHIPLKSGGFHLASDCMNQWKNRVVVDFGMTRAKVAAMTVESFDAVRPIRPVYGPREERIKELLEVARQQPQISKSKVSLPHTSD